MQNRSVADVFLDGEKVEFEGDPPVALGDLHNLLQGVLASSGRVLAGMQVDRQEFSPALAAQPLAECGRVDAQSERAEDVVTELAHVLARELPVVVDATATLAERVLQLPWTEAQPECVAMADTLARCLEGSATLAARQAVPGFDLRVEALSGALGHWVDAVQAGDAAEVSLRLDSEVVPALQAVISALHPPASFAERR
jgi:hypothetical protein